MGALGLKNYAATSAAVAAAVGAALITDNMSRNVVGWAARETWIVLS